LGWGALTDLKRAARRWIERRMRDAARGTPGQGIRATPRGTPVAPDSVGSRRVREKV